MSAIQNENRFRRINLPPIMKHDSRSTKWKELPSEGGDSVFIKDKEQKQGYLGNLKKKRQIDLEDLILRQDKLLNNKSFIKKLADNGAKIREKRDALQAALDDLRRQEKPVMPIPDMTSVEWQWREPKYAKTSSNKVEKRVGMNDELDSDDDENVDPLELLATHSSDVPSGNTKIANGAASVDPKEDPSESIRKELLQLDLMDGEEQGAQTEENQETKPKINGDAFTDFGSKLIQSLEEKASINHKKECFKPFRPKTHQKLLYSSDQSIIFKSDNEVQSKEHSSKENPHPNFGIGSKPQFQPLKNINIHKSSLWACQTSATGPLDFRDWKQVMPLSLKESVELGTKTQLKLKRLELEQAAACLARYSVKARHQNLGTKCIGDSRQYRTRSDDSESSDGDSSDE